VVAALAAVAVTGLTGCTHGSNAPPATGTSAAPSTAAPAATGDLVGDAFTVLGPWTGADQSAMQAVVTRFDRDTGAHGRYVAASDETEALSTDVPSGIGPDVAIVSGPAELASYVNADELQPLDANAQKAVAANFAGEWAALSTVDGAVFGVPVNATDESVLWDDSATLKAAGLPNPPASWAELISDGQQLSHSGLVAPVALAGGDAWTLTDWFENVYLRTAGLQAYDRLSTHQTAWTDPSVKRALKVLLKLERAASVVGPASEAAIRSYPRSLGAVFDSKPISAFVYGPGSIATALAADKDAAAATAQLFAFPSIDGSTPVAEVSAQYAVGFSTDPAVQPFLHFLATPEAARILVGTSGSDLVSPNRDVAPSAYASELTRQLAQQLTQLGDAVRPDLSELAPPPFGGTGRHSEQADLRRLLLAKRITKHTIANVQQRLEQDAAATTGWPS